METYIEYDKEESGGSYLVRRPAVLKLKDFGIVISMINSTSPYTRKRWSSGPAVEAGFRPLTHGEPVVAQARYTFVKEFRGPDAHRCRHSE